MTTDEIKERIYSIDFLRGVVMMIMLLDHTRDFVHHGAFMSDPTDPMTTTVPLFFTRWITHFCAPAFVFLSGVSIYLQKLNGKSNRELSWFLFTRGLWLIILEFTVIRSLITFNLDYGSLFGMAQVIWVIGASMIVMAALLYLPLTAVGIFGVAMIVLHNLLDGYNLPPNILFGGTLDPTQALWIVLHQQGIIPFVGGSVVFIAYPLIPWIGVMAAGYALGSIYSWDADRRRRFLLGLGFAMIVCFIAVRLTNVYGDTDKWVTRSAFVERVAARAQAAEASNANQSDDGGPPAPELARREPKLSEPAFTAIAVLNTQKYPPSLLFLLMTLGPSIFILGLTDRISGGPIWQRIGIVFGRVPLFFYILQWIWAHGSGVLLGLLTGKDIGYFFHTLGPGMELPPDHGFSLPVVYATWIVGLVVTYPLCLWYGNYKRRKKHWLLSYL